MDAAQLNSFFKETLKGSPVERPGRIYVALCDIFPLQKVRNKKRHSLALSVLSKLSEILQSNEGVSPGQKKQILNYMDALGLLVEDYEKEKFAGSLGKISGVEILEFLMEQHSLKQTDLIPELGSQSIVSEILSGKRKLNNQQIQALSNRFGVSPAAFFPS